MTRDSCDREHSGCSRTRLHVYADAPDSYEVLSQGVNVIKPSNVIIQFHASELWIPENHEHMSIRCAFNGARVYESNGGRFAVDDTSYFVLNTGHDLFSSIQSDTEVESFSFFFWPGFAQEVLRGLVTPADRLL